jgi:hypothetical protein
MLDTVVLNIPKEQIREIVDGTAQRWDLQSKTSNYRKLTKNPPRGLSDGVYRPRLTGMERNVGRGQKISFVRVEFSAPKLLFGNNLEELTDKDFELAVERLHQRLLEYGLVVSKQSIRNAAVTTFHPSKNIALTGGYTASMVSRELAKININKKFDLQKTSFRNDGQSLQGWTQAHSIVVYDKIADLAQNKKKAIDKDQAPKQLVLFEKIKAEQPSLEVLRLEIRLTQKQKINAIFKGLGLPPNPTFEQVFKKDVCQKIVQSYWNTLVEGENLFLFGAESNPKNLLKRVLRQNPKMQAKNAVYLVGLNALCNDEGGIRELRSILAKRQSPRGWYRITDGISLLNEGRSERHLHSWVRQVRQALRFFKPYRVRSPPKNKIIHI